MGNNKQKIKHAPDGKAPLDYRLISGLEDYVHSTLFNEVFLFRDLPFRYSDIWSAEFEGRFDTFFTRLHDLSKAPPDKSIKNHTETLEHWIHPILESLGWYSEPSEQRPNIIENTLFSVTDHLGNEVSLRPSILVFGDSKGRGLVNSSRKTDRALVELKNYRPIPIVTGYFNSFADRRSGKYNPTFDEVGERGDAYTALGPDLQAMRHLDILGQNWGIATDGACWRLYSQGSTSHGNVPFYEFDLHRLYNELRSSTSEQHLRLREIGKYFYWFFSHEGLTKKPISFVNRTREDSKVYTDRVEEDLKERFVHAMTIGCNAYHRAYSEKKSDIPSLDLVRDVSESFIFTLLFIRSCESGRVLPLHQDYIPVSLHNLVNKIRDYVPHEQWEKNKEIVGARLSSICKGTFRDSGVELYDYVCNLYDLVHKGNERSKNFGFVIHGFKEGLFSPVELSFHEKYKIDNRSMVQLLFELFYDMGDHGQISFRQIAFSSFSPRQLGSIYESFLGFKLEKAEETLFYVRKKTATKTYWQWVPKKKLPKKSGHTQGYSVSRGDLIFTPDNSERKATGSFYTPDYIVDYVVTKTLAPMVDKKSGKEILKIKVCDPAMGSGHFLLGALEFLTEQYLRSLPESSKPDPRIAKRNILKSCLYGVDINKSAVKLAKLSLWLATANAGQELEHLDDQLCNGDSLISNLPGYPSNFVWQTTFRDVFETGGFEAIIGNPPYVSMKKFPKTPRMIAVKDYCLSNYTAFDSKSDYFCCFVEAALKQKGLLKNGGILSMVLSVTFATEDSFHELRKILFSNTINNITYNHVNAFPGVGIRTASLIIKKSLPSENGIEFYREREDRFQFDRIGVAKQRVFSNIGCFVAIPEEQNLEILQKIGYLEKSDQFLPLVELVKHKDKNGDEKLGFLNGISSGDNDFWLIDGLRTEGDSERAFKAKGHKKLNLEKFYCGSDIQRYGTEWGKRWVNYLWKEMIDHNRAKNKGTLNSKGGQSNARPRQYYYDENDMFFHPRDAIVNSLISSQRIVADIDSGKKFWDINVNLIFPNERLISASALLGLLNSRFVGIYLLGNIRSNLSVTQGHLEKLPLPKLSKKNEEKLASLVKEMRESVKLGEQSKAEKLDHKIDKLVNELYGLSEAECLYVESFIARYLSQSASEEPSSVDEAA